MISNVCRTCKSLISIGHEFCIPCQSLLKEAPIGTVREIMQIVKSTLSARIDHYDVTKWGVLDITFEQDEVVDINTNMAKRLMKMGWMITFFSNNIEDNDDFQCNINITPIRDMIKTTFNMEDSLE